MRIAKLLALTLIVGIAGSSLAACRSSCCPNPCDKPNPCGEKPCCGQPNCGCR